MLKLASIALILSTTACGSNQVKYEYPKAAQEVREQRIGSFLGEKNNINVFGNKKSSHNNLAINHYLWKATLDVVSFMPLNSVDSNSGMIITDWYNDVKAPRERFKFNIRIHGDQLKVEAVKITAFKQILNDKLVWQDAETQTSTIAREFEDKIIDRARQVYVSKE